MTTQLYRKEPLSWKRTGRIPCPVCGRRNDGCMQAEHKPHLILCIHQENPDRPEPVNGGLGGWVWNLNTGGAVVPWVDRAICPPTPHQRAESGRLLPLLPAEVRDQCIRFFLGHSGLGCPYAAGSPYWDWLEADGLLQVAERRGYRVLPADGESRQAILQDMERQFGRETLLGSAFVHEQRTAQGACLQFSGPPVGYEALLFSVQDVRGRVIAVKTRWEVPRRGLDGTPFLCDGMPILERRYMPMSMGSPSFGIAGSGVNTPIHVARPVWCDPWRERVVIITEGEKKGDKIADTLGVTTLGLGGVANWNGQAEGRQEETSVFPILASLAPLCVVIAFDADREQKPQVRREKEKLAQALIQARYVVCEYCWDQNEGKGLDDYLQRRSQEGEPLWPSAELARGGKTGEGFLREARRRRCLAPPLRRVLPVASRMRTGS